MRFCNNTAASAASDITADFTATCLLFFIFASGWQVGWLRKKSENTVFRHSGESRNPVLSSSRRPSGLRFSLEWRLFTRPSNLTYKTIWELIEFYSIFNPLFNLKRCRQMQAGCWYGENKTGALLVWKEIGTQLLAYLIFGRFLILRCCWPKVNRKRIKRRTWGNS